MGAGRIAPIPMSAPTPSLVSQLAQSILLRDFRERQFKSRFAVRRVGQPSWRAARLCFSPSLAPGTEAICPSCRNYAHSPMLVCAIYPHGPGDTFCRDFQPGEPPEAL